MVDSSSDSRDRVSIGLVRRSVGLDGSVEVEVYSGDSARLAPGQQVFSGDRVLTVAVSRPGRRGSVVARFEGVEDRDAADNLHGAELEVPESALPEAAEGSYYHFQIIGCRVVTIAGDDLGVVTGVMETGANDVYVVERPGRGELLVPAVRSVVRAIDTAARIITIDPPHGLIE